MQNKIILITGSASGFGKAASTKLLAKGHIVYGADMDTENNQYLNEIGGHPIHMDVTNDKMVNAGVQRIIDEQGRIDVLVNNAGYGAYSTIEHIEMDELQHQFNVNVFGFARLQKAVLPHMRQQRSGRIINLSSMVGEVSAPLVGWYAATKHAIEAMSDSLRMEVKDLGIEVVKIKPGPANTSFVGLAFDKLESSKVSEDYLPMSKEVTLGMQEVYANCENSENTANYIVKAIEAKKPKANYRTNPEAKQSGWAKRLLSDQLIDKIMFMELRKFAKKARNK